MFAAAVHLEVRGAQRSVRRSLQKCRARQMGAADFDPQ